MGPLKGSLLVSVCFSDAPMTDALRIPALSENSLDRGQGQQVTTQTGAQPLVKQRLCCDYDDIQYMLSISHPAPRLWIISLKPASRLQGTGKIHMCSVMEKI